MSIGRDGGDRPLVLGTLAGVAAWLVGYVATYVVTATDLQDSALAAIVEFFGGRNVTAELVGWVYYNAHFVPVQYENVGPFTPPLNFIGGEEGFTVLLYLLPPAVLVAAGLAVARARGSRDAETGARVGAFVAPGYLAVTLLGLVLTQVTLGDAAGAPALPAGIVIAGVLYPIVFGAAGGALGGYTAD